VDRYGNSRGREEKGGGEGVGGGQVRLASSMRSREAVALRGLGGSGSGSGVGEVCEQGGRDWEFDGLCLCGGLRRVVCAYYDS
jgi:hypothetical protein